MRYLYLTLWLAFFSTAGNSQPVSAGFHFGPTLSTLNFEFPPIPIVVELDPWDYRVGFAAAGNLTWHFSKTAALRGELSFERKGARKVETFSNASGDPVKDSILLDRSDYLSLPILFELNFGEKTQGLIHVGHALAMQVAHETTYPDRITVRDDKQTIQFLIPQEYEKLDHFLLVGLGVSIPFQDNMKIIAGGRTAIGLRNINKFEGVETKNFSVALTVGLQYVIF
jgi:hypothetical protein